MQAINRWTLMTTALSVLALPALGQERGSGDTLGNSIFGNKHMFSLGIAEQNADAIIRSTVGEATPISISLDDLGIDDSDQTVFFEYRYRLGEKWSILAATYQFSGSGQRIGERDFNFDGTEFTAGSNIQGNIEVDAYFLDLMYQVYRSDKLEIKLGGGLHALDLGADISAEIAIDGSQADFRSGGSTLLAPVPNFRASATWMLGENYGLRFVGGWLSAEIDEYEGSFSYGHIRGFYAFTDRFGVSAGYQVTDVDVTQNRRFSELEFDVNLEGPTLTFTYSF